MAWQRLALAVTLMMQFPCRPAHAGTTPADLSGLFADAAMEAWPAGLIPIGAGTAVAGEPFVLTAAHVIAGCSHMEVARDGQVPRAVALVGLDSRLDLALLEDKTAGDADGSELAAVMATGSDAPPPPGTRLHVTGFGQPGHATGDPVRIEVRPAGLIQDLSERPLLLLLGRLVPGTSGSPVLNRDGNSIGMVVGQLRADRARGVAVRSADLLRFLAYFGLMPPIRARGRQPAEGVMVQCVN